MKRILMVMVVAAATVVGTASPAAANRGPCPAGFTYSGAASDQWRQVRNLSTVPMSKDTATISAPATPFGMITTLSAVRLTVHPFSPGPLMGNFTIRTEVSGVSRDRFQTKHSAGNPTLFTFNNAWSTAPNRPGTVTITASVEASNDASYAYGAFVWEQRFGRCTFDPNPRTVRWVPLGGYTVR
jgi:hypothetical protein